MCVGIIKLGVAQAESSVWDIAVSRKSEQQIFYRAVCEHVHKFEIHSMKWSDENQRFWGSHNNN